MADTSIEWTRGDDGRPGKVWNVTRGCSRVSPGCGGAKGEGGCYAERQAARLAGHGGPYEGLVRIGKQGPRWTGQMEFVLSKLTDPLGWKKPARIFVNSMSDLFHEGLSNEEIAAVFGVMAQCPQHTFQILTKRAKRMRQWFEWVEGDGDEHAPPGDFFVTTCAVNLGVEMDQLARPWPLPNVWLGVSCEDQQRAEERIPELLATPAAVRFVSAEPLLGPIDFRIDPDGTESRFGLLTCPRCRGWGVLRRSSSISVDGHPDEMNCSCNDGCALDWSIVGSESGPGARPMDVAWARSIVDQCKPIGVSVFVKQIATAEGRRAGDKKGGDPQYWPPGDWPREFPGTPS